MLLHFSLFTMPTHFKSINTVSRFWLTDCHLVSHTLLDKKKKRRLVYSTGTETTRRKRMGPRKGCNGSTTMPLESTSMKPSTASSRAAAVWVPSMNPKLLPFEWKFTGSGRLARRLFVSTNSRYCGATIDAGRHWPVCLC